MIIFDFDGTLADTMPRLTAAATELLCALYDRDGGWARQHYLETTGLSFREQLDQIFPRLREENRHAADVFLTSQKEIYETADFHYGALEQLKYLDYLGEKYAIVTSSPLSPVYGLMKRHGLFPLRLTVLGQDNGPKESQLKTLAARNPESVFIGDTVIDGQIAARCGVYFIGVEHTFPRSTFRDANLESVQDLETAVKEALEVQVRNLASETESSSHATSQARSGKP